MTEILKKCLEELSKETPKLDYVRGMLETVIELQATPVVVSGTFGKSAPTPGFANGSNDVPTLDAAARSAIEAARLAELG